MLIRTFSAVVSAHTHTPTPISREEILFWSPIILVTMTFVVSWTTIVLKISNIKDRLNQNLAYFKARKLEFDEIRKADRLSMREWITQENQILSQEINNHFELQSEMLKEFNERLHEKKDLIAKLHAEQEKTSFQLAFLITQLKNNGCINS